MSTEEQTTIQDQIFAGGCNCGAIRFEYKYGKDSQPVFNMFCHCQMCRRYNGASGVHLLAVPRPAFTITKGQELLKTYQKSPKSHRSFCPTCGVGITQGPVEGPFIATYPTNYDVCATQFPLQDKEQAAVILQVFQPMVHTNMENSFIPKIYSGGLVRFKDFPGAYGGSNMVYTNDDCTECIPLEE